MVSSQRINIIAKEQDKVRVKQFNQKLYTSVSLYKANIMNLINLAKSLISLSSLHFLMWATHHFVFFNWFMV